MAVESRQQFICEGMDAGADSKFAGCRPIDMPDAITAARLKAILDTTVDGIVTINEKAIIQSFNKAAERIFGYSASEVIGRNVKVLIPSPHREHHDEFVGNYLRTGVRKIIGIGREVEGQRKDGRIFPLYLAVSEAWVGNERIVYGDYAGPHRTEGCHEGDRESGKVSRGKSSPGVEAFKGRISSLCQCSRRVCDRGAELQNRSGAPVHLARCRARNAPVGQENGSRGRMWKL